MKRKRRRLVSVQSAIVKLGLPMSGIWCLTHGRWNDGCPPIEVAPTPDPLPTWYAPCTATPACRRCWACLVAEHGRDFWMKGIT